MRVLVWKKAPRRQAQGHPHDPLLQPVAAGHDPGGEPGGDLRHAVVDRVQQPDQLGMGLRRADRRAGHLLLGPGEVDHGHEHLARRDPLAHHHVAQVARLRPLVVGGHLLADRPGAHALAHRVAERRGQQARAQVDHLVPAARARASRSRPPRCRARPSTPSCCGSRRPRRPGRAPAPPPRSGARCAPGARPPGRASRPGRRRSPGAAGGSRRSAERTGTGERRGRGRDAGPPEGRPRRSGGAPW